MCVSHYVNVPPPLFSKSDGSGNFYDLSSLSRSSLTMASTNWLVVPHSSVGQRYYLNVCKSLVPQSGKRAGPGFKNPRSLSSMKALEALLQLKGFNNYKQENRCTSHVMLAPSKHS